MCMGARTIKMVLRDARCDAVNRTEITGSGGPMASLCEHGNERSHILSQHVTRQHLERSRSWNSSDYHFEASCK
jgi:hypothetical protein